MKRLFTISFQFYRLTLTYNVAFSILIIFLGGMASKPGSGLSILQPKIWGFICAVALYSFLSQKTFYYFRNAGYRMSRIILCAFLIDLAITIIVISTFSLTAYAISHFKG